MEYKTFFEKAWAELKEETKIITHEKLTEDIPLMNEYQRIKNQFPQVENIISLIFDMAEEFHNTDCYMLKNYSQMKASAEEKVKIKLSLLDQNKFDTLSPTEKYDIMMGYYDFRTTSFEKEYKGKRRWGSTRNSPLLSTFAFNRYWEGRCNADRAAGICRRYFELRY
jgi:hypothetical protein